MNTPVTEMPAPVVFTQAAAGKVAELIAEDGTPNSSCVCM